jgi:hypothetical protein
MSHIKKIDVKNYLSSRNRKGIHLYRPTSQPDATGFSSDETASAKVKSKRSQENAGPAQPPNGLNIGVSKSTPGSAASLQQVVFRSAQS